MECDLSSISPFRIGRIAIVTDSVAQLPAELARELGIWVVPLVVSVEGQRYLDGVDLDPEDLYRRMRLDKNLQLSTSSPSAGQFYSVFLDCLENGAESVLYIGLTSRLSGTFSAAEGGSALAKEEYGERQIILFDTRIATIAQGFLVIEAARMVQRGETVQRILEVLTAERQHVGLVATLETLEYLARGGRIGKAAYMVGSMIHILPMVTIDEEGVVAPVGMVRSHHAALEKMLDFVDDRVREHTVLNVAIMHANSLKQAQELQQLVINRLRPDEAFLTSFTPVMTVHAGPGLIGLAYHWK